MGSRCDLINIRVSSARINGVYVGRNSRITMQGKNTHIVVGKSTLHFPYGVKAGGHSAAGRHPNVGHSEFGTIFLIHPLTIAETLTNIKTSIYILMFLVNLIHVSCGQELPIPNNYSVVDSISGN